MIRFYLAYMYMLGNPLEKPTHCGQYVSCAYFAQAQCFRRHGAQRRWPCPLKHIKMTLRDSQPAEYTARVLTFQSSSNAT